MVAVSREGLTEEGADAIAYDLAAAVATQIEGEAIAGQSVRDLLQPHPAEGCEESARCGRETAATLKTDEVLLLSMHVAGKTTVVTCYRVPREPTRPLSNRTLRLFGGKAKRVQAVMELVTMLYPPGSATEYVAPEPPKKQPVVAVSEKREKPEEAEAPKEGKPIWLWVGIGAGAAVVVVIVAVVLGVVLGTTRAPTGPAVTLP